MIVRNRNKVVGRLSPETQGDAQHPVEWPDFAARRKALFGDQILPGADLLIEERESYRY
jgi:hypothetical protein